MQNVLNTPDIVWRYIIDAVNMTSLNSLSHSVKMADSTEWNCYVINQQLSPIFWGQSIILVLSFFIWIWIKSSH